MNWNEYAKWVTHPAVQALFLAGGGYVLAFALDLTVGRLVVRLAHKTETDIDNATVEACRPAIKQSIILVGFWVATQHLSPPDIAQYAIRGVLGTWAIGVWVLCAFRITEVFLQWFSLHRDRFHTVNVRTLPIFDIAVKAGLIGTGFYFVFLAWSIDVTGWLASAGILGVVLGFGAKDTVADLFAGVFILADAPYKRGDYLLLNTGDRGRVTRIGVRTTRILTPDEVEIIVPNSMMASGMLSNESGGPQEIERVNVAMSVAYGSDIDRVRAVLLEEAAQISGVLQDDPLHRSSVHFGAMADSGLALQLRVWIVRPEHRLAVIDAINDRVYKRLQAEGIEIPYPKRDVYLHSEDG